MRKIPRVLVYFSSFFLFRVNCCSTCIHFPPGSNRQRGSKKKIGDGIGDSGPGLGLRQSRVVQSLAHMFLYVDMIS